MQQKIILGLPIYIKTSEERKYVKIILFGLGILGVLYTARTNEEISL